MTGDTAGERGGWASAVRWVAAGLHVLIGFFPYAASGVMAPPAGLVVLGLVWLGLFLVVLRWRPRTIWLLLAVPPVAVAVWFVIMQVGDSLLGWTA